jgi:hypothetical protein
LEPETSSRYSRRLSGSRSCVGTLFRD